MLTQYLTALVLIPILGFIGSIVIPRKWERAIFFVSIATIVSDFLVFLALGYQWVTSGAAPISISLGSVYASEHYTFSLDYFFDGISAVFLGIAAIIVALAFIFSRYYLHREAGFKRFYCTVLLFFIGLSLIILAGNFEVLLLGWELIGISSVLLIAFYRDRYLPAKNALKVFSVYRIADAFLLAAIWYAHHIFESQVKFSEFSHLALEHGNEIALLGLLILVAAVIKSAQFPFSYWLPRAMEGPTSSSAIFYGALSVHMGLFLLLRTYPLWSGFTWLHVLIAALGLITAVSASSITRVQSSIKAQIAYASITQIGIMFIEVALGLPWLALIHFVCNASLRTYQLLISPSIVGYLVHDQFFHFTPPPQRIGQSLLGKIRATLYILSMKEWNMDTVESNYFWRRLKSIGRAFAFLDSTTAQFASVALLLVAACASTLVAMSTNVALGASTLAAIVSIVFYIRAYTTKGSAIAGWNLIMLGNLFGVLFLELATGADWKYIIMYGVGVVAAFIAGRIILNYLETCGDSITLQQFQGSIYAHEVLGHAFFIVCLLFIVFPISPSFLAQEVFLSLIPKAHAFQIVLFCLSYLLAGVSTMRIFVKVFFGPQEKGHHETAYKSS